MVILGAWLDAVYTLLWSARSLPVDDRGECFTHARRAGVHDSPYLTASVNDNGCHLFAVAFMRSIGGAFLEAVAI